MLPRFCSSWQVSNPLPTSHDTTLLKLFALWIMVCGKPKLRSRVLCYDVYLNDLHYLILLISYRIERNRVFFSDFCKIPKEFGLWTFCCQYNNVYVLSVQCVFRHVHSVTAVVQPFDDFLISLNTGRPPHGRVVLAAHRDHRHRGVSASAADDPARAGERWRGVRPEPSQLLALIRFRRQLRDWPEERAAAPSGLERGHVRLHAVHAARLAWAANAAGHRRPASQLRSREHRRLEDRITRWLICKFLSSLYSTCYLLVLSQFKHVRYSMFAPIAQVWFCTSEFVMQRDQ